MKHKNPPLRLKNMKLISYHWRSFLEDPWQSRYAIPLLLVNAGGSVYGYYWYSNQLAETAVKWWFFVPDSPLATTMLAAVLALSLLGYRNAFINLVSFTANIKYGLWAVIVISDFWTGGGAIRYTEAMLWVSHLGMAAQGFIFLRSYILGSPTCRKGHHQRMKATGIPKEQGFHILSPVSQFRPLRHFQGKSAGPGRGVTGPALAATAAWMLLNDFLDYYLGIYPYLYHPGQLLLGAVSAVALSLAIAISLKIYAFKKLANNSR